MNEADRFRLLHGPYRMPRCRVGRRLKCLVRGRVKVFGITDAPIPWPYTRRENGCGPPIMIVCGDLARAIRCESEQAVAAPWRWSASSKPPTRRDQLGVERW